MTSDQIQEIRGMLTEACDLHIANGGRIRSICFDNGKGARCPIGCLVGESPTSEYIKPAASILGLEYPEILWDFIHAFDDISDYPATRSPLAALGHELRDMYIGK